MRPLPLEFLFASQSMSMSVDLLFGEGDSQRWEATHERVGGLCVSFAGLNQRQKGGALH